MSGAHLLDHLAANPLLTLMLVLSTGALLGQIKFGRCASAPPAPCSWAW